MALVTPGSLFLPWTNREHEAHNSAVAAHPDPHPYPPLGGSSLGSPNLLVEHLPKSFLPKSAQPCALPCKCYVHSIAVSWVSLSQLRVLLL